MEKIIYDRYRVCDTGEIYGTYGTALLPYENEYGHLCVKLCVDGQHKNKTIHRLVAEAFVPNPDNLPFVKHRDGDPQNNHAANLMWCKTVWG